MKRDIIVKYRNESKPDKYQSKTIRNRYSAGKCASKEKALGNTSSVSQTYVTNNSCRRGTERSTTGKQHPNSESENNNIRTDGLHSSQKTRSKSESDLTKETSPRNNNKQLVSLHGTEKSPPSTSTMKGKQHKSADSRTLRLGTDRQGRSARLPSGGSTRHNEMTDKSPSTDRQGRSDRLPPGRPTRYNEVADKSPSKNTKSKHLSPTTLSRSRVNERNTNSECTHIIPLIIITSPDGDMW